MISDEVENRRKSSWNTSDILQAMSVLSMLWIRQTILDIPENV